MNKSMKNEITLDVIETLTPSVVFIDGGVEDIVSKLENYVRSISLDATTEKGRKNIKSVAYKVARSKTALDDMGKKVQADAKAVVDKVNADRRVISSRLDALRDEVRRPVDEYEAREKERVDGIRDRIAQIEILGVRLEGLDIETLKASAEEIGRLKDYDFQEFSARAQLACEQTKNLIFAAIIIAEKAEAERIEAEKLAAQKAEADRLAALEAQKIREAEIARAAADKARKDAEEQVNRERKAAAEALERERQEAERKRLQAEKVALNERKRIEEQAKAAILREKALAKEIQDARELAEQEKIQAQTRVEEEKKKAVLLERKRIENERKADEAAEKKRIDNKEHKIKINNEALNAICSFGLTVEQGKLLIKIIATGGIPHVSIKY